MFLLAQRRHFTQVAQRLDRAVMQSWVRKIGPAVAGRDLDSLSREAQFLTQGSGGAAYVYILSPDGSFVVHSDPAFAWKALEEWEPSREQAGVRDMREPVQLYGGMVGEAVIGFRSVAAEQMHRVQVRNILPPLLYVNFTIIVLVLLASLGVSRGIIRPVRQLAAAARDIREGRLDIRLAVGTSDELGSLQGEFNSMASRLKELDDLKTDFLAKITHDLRNPLGAVMGYAEVMLLGIRGPVSSEQQKCLKLMISNADYLSELINNILDVTKLEAGRMEYARTNCDLSGVVEPVVELMKVKADEYGVALVHDVPADFPQAEADPQALRRVLMNLVSNALKFTPQGGQVRVSASVESGGGLRMTVHDSGIGIPREKLPLLFSKFAQVHDRRDLPRQVRGTGLGLAICKEIVEGHGGRIWAESEPGRGTAFQFTIATAPKEAATPLLPPDQPLGRGGARP